MMAFARMLKPYPALIVSPGASGTDHGFASASAEFQN